MNSELHILQDQDSAMIAKIKPILNVQDHDQNSMRNTKTNTATILFLRLHITKCYDLGLAFDH